MLTDTQLAVTQRRITAMGLIMVSEVILFQINIFKETFDGKHELHCSFKIKKMYEDNTNMFKKQSRQT